MGISLNGLTPAGTYPGLIKTGDNTAISGTPKVLSDGNGNNLPMEVSTTGVNFTNQLQQGGVAVPTASQVAAKQDTLVSGTNIKTINGTSVLGSGNIVTPSTNPSGVSGAIQFSNGSAFASDATNFFWDNTNKRLGVGTNTPTASFVLNAPDAEVIPVRIQKTNGDLRFYISAGSGGSPSLSFARGGSLWGIGARGTYNDSFLISTNGNGELPVLRVSSTIVPVTNNWLLILAFKLDFNSNDNEPTVFKKE